VEFRRSLGGIEFPELLKSSGIIIVLMRDIDACKYIISDIDIDACKYNDCVAINILFQI